MGFLFCYSFSMSSNNELICVSANGKRVVFDLVASHAALHFREVPELRELVKEAVSAIPLEGDLIAKDIDMGRIIGASNVVETTSKDTIVYAMRQNRPEQGYVPFTKSQPPQPSPLLSVYLTKIEDDTYQLESTWIGHYESPKFPEMEHAEPESVSYWSTHAFAWGSQEIIPDSVLHICPW